MAGPTFGRKKRKKGKKEGVSTSTEPDICPVFIFLREITLKLDVRPLLSKNKIEWSGGLQL